MRRVHYNNMFSGYIGQRENSELLLLFYTFSYIQRLERVKSCVNYILCGKKAQ